MDLHASTIIPQSMQIASEAEKQDIKTVLESLNAVHEELMPLISKVDDYSRNYLNNKYDRDVFLYSIYRPDCKKGELLGDALHYPTHNMYLCIALFAEVSTSVQVQGMSIEIPEKWINENKIKSQSMIRMHLCNKLHDQVCKCASEFNSVPDDINNLMLEINEIVAYTGNVEDQYTKKTINRIISIYENIYDKDLGEGLTLFDIASHIEDMYPNVMDKIITKINKIGIGDTEYEVEQVDCTVIIKGLLGKNMYDNDIHSSIKLEVPADLYLRSDADIENYLISHNLRQLNKIIVGSQARICNVLTKYELNEGEFDPIRSAFDGLDISKKVNDYGSI